MSDGHGREAIQDEPSALFAHHEAAVGIVTEETLFEQVTQRGPARRRRTILQPGDRRGQPRPTRVHVDALPAPGATQLERLAQLEAHFRKMLALQQPITKATRTMHKIAQQRKLQRGDRINLARLAQGEAHLKQMAQQALDIIVEDGTSVVFPRIVEQLGIDLDSAGKLIKAEKTGRYTQKIQRDIEETLKELIEALEKAQQQKKDNPPPPPKPGQPPPPQEPPLLPSSAELKLLRSAQLRVNRRTKVFDDTRPDGDLEPIMQQEVARIAKQQDDVAEITLEMVERN